MSVYHGGKDTGLTQTVKIVFGAIVTVYEFLNKGKEQRRRPVGIDVRIVHRVVSKEQTLNHRLSCHRTTRTSIKHTNLLRRAQKGS
jgi:hypothetical protein